MMDWLWQWDRQIFRWLHEGVQGSAVEPGLVLVTDSGLGQVQLAALLWVVARARFGAAASWAVATVLLLALTAVSSDPMHAAAAVLVGILVRRLDERTAVSCLMAGLIAGACRLAIVEWADRMRPSNFLFSHPAEPVFGSSSFPSGHSTTAFAIAFAALLLGPYRATGWALFAWAAAVGFSRIAFGVHYPTDVLGAAALGLLGGVAVAAWRRAQARDEAPVNSA